MQEKVI